MPPKIRNEKKNLKNKLDVIRQEEQSALGLIKKDADGRPRRPYSSASVTSVKDAEKWRSDCMKEIVGRVTKISDPTLEDTRVRDLNDLINRRFREKRMWEMKIIELGGPDYTKNSRNDLALGGVAVPGTKGYRYFGRAKALDGVKELFEQAATMQEKVKPQELVQRVDADYYGYRDEEDGLLLQYESLQENQLRAQILEENSMVENDQFESDFILPPTIPTQAEMEEFLVEKKKQQMLSKYLPPPSPQKSHASPPAKKRKAQEVVEEVVERVEEKAVEEPAAAPAKKRKAKKVEEEVVEKVEEVEEVVEKVEEEEEEEEAAGPSTSKKGKKKAAVAKAPKRAAASSSKAAPSAKKAKK